MLSVIEGGLLQVIKGVWDRMNMLEGNYEYINLGGGGDVLFLGVMRGCG